MISLRAGALADPVLPMRAPWGNQVRGSILSSDADQQDQDENRSMTLLHSLARQFAGPRAVLFAGAVFMASSAAAAPLPGGAGSLVETFQDWVVACQSQDTTTTCALRQVQTNTQNNQTILTVEFRNAAGGKLEGTLVMPFGLALTKGVTLKVDETAIGALGFSTCVPQGCLVPMGLDAAQVTKLKAGTALNIGATALSPAQPLTLKVSLKGFPTALSRVLELTK